MEALNEIELLSYNVVSKFKIINHMIELGIKEDEAEKLVEVEFDQYLKAIINLYK